MKLSKQTLGILKNFSTINQSIVIKPGNILQTISDVKDIFARVEVTETFPCQITIYDLNEFLGVVGLFEDPELDFGDDCVVISEGRQKQVFYYADASIITQAPDKGVVLPSVEVTGTINKDVLSKISRAAAINSATHISFKNGDLVVQNKAVPNSNSFVIEGISSNTSEYELSVGVDKLKMVADDYNVNVCSKGMAQFTGSAGVEYAVALTTDGYFNG